MSETSTSLHGVTVRRVQALRGPNLYAYKPVLKVVMDIGPLEERPSNSFPGFVERLMGWLPGLHEHECSVGRPGGFHQRLLRGTYLPHIVEHVTLALQNLVGFDVGYGRARGAGEPGVYNVVIAYEEEEPARAAFDMALRLVLAGMFDEPFDFAAEIERLHEVADDYRLGPSTRALANAARRRKIPVRRITPTGSLLQLGQGIHQKRILASQTSDTTAIAVDICQEKPLTNRMLRTVGVPVPEGETVRSADEAWRVAQDLGLPVVLKPEGGNQGKGVLVNLRSEREVRDAFEVSSQYDSRVLVERHIEGLDYRLLVVGGKMVAAARRDPALVVGDGHHTVAMLVDIVNQDPRRRPGHSGTLSRIKLDDAAKVVLAQQGMTTESVPEPGQVVRLRQNCNLSTGGTATDVTDDVHPENARLAELAAQILDLDVAGIDMLCRDISRPIEEQAGAIVEVNAAPGLRMHLEPAVGTPRDVGAAIIDMLYPPGAPSRIPLVAVTGTNGKTTVTRLVAHMFETARRVVGFTCTDGTYIAGKRIIQGDCSGPRSAQAVLLHPKVEAAVLEVARGGILREGLGFDWCSVGVVTNLSPDHLGQGGVNTLEELARVKQVVVESVAESGAAVLNADDPHVAEMAAASRGRVVYFGRSADGPVMASHLADGGAGVFVEDGAVVTARGSHRQRLVDLERVPLTAGGTIRFQLENVLAASAAAWAAGINPAMIARALNTFRSDPLMTPGRFNMMSVGGRQIIVDYGHNTAAMRALAEALPRDGSRKTLMVVGLPGDRRDEDLLTTFQAALPMADEYVVHDLKNLRGRAKDEVPRMFMSCVTDGRPCHLVEDQSAGVTRAFHRTQPGDRIIVIADEVDEALDLVNALACEHDEELCSTPVWSGGAVASAP
ncbi:cyanophycin synthetase [Pyxidicoccus fallax]|uniref:Cyanophycin synthetase n=1 Tax=Pyxidicoccus fallax TaxID=394095 RepID=A0A848L8B2_9BACT|nr:cyanophycin synthetase [Pyxidicoccus fallax]NMO15039.1 cyanophycin synthetase [Pyxidicoccus fallax]NPC78061.1 cyanophycin synthetase [Pyxidicoccus fallax]